MSIATMTSSAPPPWSMPRSRCRRWRWSDLGNASFALACCRPRASGDRVNTARAGMLQCCNKRPGILGPACAGTHQWMLLPLEHHLGPREERVDCVVEAQIVLRCRGRMCDARHHHVFLVRDREQQEELDQVRVAGDAVMLPAQD